ncbi:unnamed protein product [Schistosoma margrebowiei]|uniref:Uncharacterized protein n=1 Tax=Schistosoma margrebowiei TaxID=48269 RepID=A0AA85A9H3_9TREM|nr:unnamed protein product [Schistosoma margrebowiei]
MEIIYQPFNKNLYYIIINLFSIQFNLSYQQLYPTDFQSLNLGSCIKNDGDLFCQMYRRNSFCSIQHDECFCLPGYVSIYEMNDSWYTCKPLLTDLYCRIDSDCSYIHGSICHPGVGACVCPSGYEFVFQHFSCLPRVNDSSNPFCTACQRIDGVCVLNNRKNGLLLDKYHQNDLQCACPRKPNISVIKKYSFLDICNPIPVDIGEECNHINKVCLSQKAICLDSSINIRQTQSTTNRNVNICVCHEGMIPVYQKNLDYFECYINSDKTKINIESDQYKQREQLSEFHIKRKDCIEYLLQITCNQESIHICFKNPYQTSMIRTNHRSRNIQVYLDASRIYPEFIQHEFNYSIDNQKCYLIKQNNHNHNEYCLLINFNQFNELRQCGIYEISYKYGSVFYGTLHAEITKNEVSLLRNVHIDFVCHINVSYLNGSNLSTSYFYDRSIIFKKRTGQLALSQKSPGINNFLPTKHIEKDTLQDEKTRNTNSSSISLSIINLTKNISQNQEMTLKISSTLSEFILIEYCLVKGQSIPSKVLPTYEHEKLLDLKCFNTNIHRIKQIIDIYNNNLIEYQCILFKRIIHHRTSNNNHSIWISQSFHLNNISLYNTVYSTCLIRVCQIEQLCTYAEFYSLNRTNKQYNDPYVQSKVYIPLIMLNNNNNYRNKSKLSHLFPPINFNNLIQFYFIQSTLQINQTNINIQLNDSIDVYFKHSTINVNRSLEYVWIKYILGISIFTLMCQIIIFSFKHLKKCYTKYKFVNHRNPFVMTAVTNEVQQSVNRDVNSKQICHNDLHVENKCELHNTNVIMNDNRLNKEIKDIKCDRIEHNSLDYQQQTSHSMTCLLIYPSNKSNKCRLLFNHNHNHNNNTRLHYTNSCLSSPIHCQYNQNHLSQFMIDSCVKSKNINLSQRISKSTLNIATNHQMKVSTEQLTLNEYDKMNQVNHKNHSLFNNYTHRNVFLPTCYHNDCLKQKYGYCTVYHSLKNQDYKDGWV